MGDEEKKPIKTKQNKNKTKPQTNREMQDSWTWQTARLPSEVTLLVSAVTRNEEEIWSASHESGHLETAGQGVTKEEATLHIGMCGANSMASHQRSLKPRRGGVWVVAGKDWTFFELWICVRVLVKGHVCIEKGRSRHAGSSLVIHRNSPPALFRDATQPSGSIPCLRKLP